MRAYLSAFRIRAAAELQYRAAVVSGVVTQIFFGFIILISYRVMYESGTTLSVGFAATATYVWLQQSFFRILLNQEGSIYSAILTGGIAYELCRPIDQYFYWFSRALAARLVAGFTRAVFVLPLAFFLPEPYRLALPVSAGAAAGFLVSLVLGAAVGCSVDALAQAVTMKTLDSRGIANFISLLHFLTSGILVPLYMFPEPVRTVLYLTPLSQGLDPAARIWQGTVAGAEIFLTLGIQAFWLLAMLAFGRFLWRRFIPQLAIQGG